MQKYFAGGVRYTPMRSVRIAGDRAADAGRKGGRLGKGTAATGREIPTAVDVLALDALRRHGEEPLPVQLEQVGALPIVRLQEKVKPLGFPRRGKARKIKNRTLADAV